MTDSTGTKPLDPLRRRSFGRVEAYWHNGIAMVLDPTTGQWRACVPVEDRAREPDPWRQ